MGFEDLTPELQDKVLACESPEELLELAQQEGRELTDEELEEIAGGVHWGHRQAIKYPHPQDVFLSSIKETLRDKL